MVRAFHAFPEAPRAGAVYNLGGGRGSNFSMLEAIEMCERIAGRDASLHARPTRPASAITSWYVSDFGDFERDYPAWQLTFGIDEVLRDIYDFNAERWTAGASVGR